MKKLLSITLVIFSCLCALLFCGCQSNEDKAKKFAEENIPKFLNDASSYEAVETKVDSAFANILIDSEAMSAAVEINEQKEKQEELERDMDNAKSSMAIFAPTAYYDSSYDKEQRRQANEKIKEIQEELSESKAEIKAQERIILKRNKMIEKGKFIGWGIQHSFRCKNGMGISMLAQSLLVTDKDFKNVLFRIIVATKLDEEEIENARKEIERVLKMNGVDK